MNNIYWLYFKDVMRHKKNVFLECRKVKGLWWRGVTHDLSKLLPCEFIPYAKYFYGENGVKIERVSPNDSEPYMNGRSCYSRNYLRCKREFDIAVDHHYAHNTHHWNQYKGSSMDFKDIDEMLCDWKAMGKKFGNTAQEFYLKNYKKLDLHWGTRMYIEMALDLNFSEAHGYGHTMEQFAKLYTRKDYDNYFGHITEQYGIDTYLMLSNCGEELK